MHLLSPAQQVILIVLFSRGGCLDGCGDSCQLLKSQQPESVKTPMTHLINTERDFVVTAEVFLTTELICMKMAHVIFARPCV